MRWVSDLHSSTGLEVLSFWKKIRMKDRIGRLNCAALLYVFVKFHIIMWSTILHCMDLETWQYHGPYCSARVAERLQSNNLTQIVVPPLIGELLGINNDEPTSRLLTIHCVAKVTSELPLYVPTTPCNRQNLSERGRSPKRTSFRRPRTSSSEPACRSQSDMPDEYARLCNSQA